MGSVSLIKWLLSPQNTRGFRQINVETIPGKKRAVAFEYDHPFCFDVSTPNGVTCNTARQVIANPTEETVFTFDSDPFRMVDGEGDPMRFEIDQADLKKYCTETDTSYIDRKIMALLKRYEEAIDKQLSILLAAGAGTDANGNATVRLPFFTTNTATNSSVVNDDAIFWLDQNYRDIGGEDMYGLIGGKVLNKLIAKNKWAGLNQAGIDLAKVADEVPYPYYNRNMDATLGTDTFLQLSPGAAQLVVFNEFKGENKREVTDLYTHDTIISPYTGLPIDFEWMFDYKCKKWTFEPFSYLQLAINHPGGCGLPTSNGIMKIEDCSNGIALPSCPEEPGN